MITLSIVAGIEYGLLERTEVEAMVSVSQHVFRALGFRDILSASYKDFLFNGEAVFSSIVGPEATILMEQEL